MTQNTNQNWTQLWIGHPWIYYRRNGNLIEFSDYTELSLEEFKDIAPSFSVSENTFGEQLSIIRQQHTSLELEFKKVLNKMGVSHPETVTNLIMGNG